MQAADQERTEEGGLIRWFMSQAEVAQVTSLSSRFRLIELRGNALRGSAWSPGQTIQVLLGSLYVSRTYTPISWDGERGYTQLLGYSHGVGPGSEWVRSVRRGDVCRVVGPASSLDLTNVPRPVLWFGDEASFGAALAFRQTVAQECEVEFVFEVSSRVESESVLHAVGLNGARVIARTGNDAHLKAIEDSLRHGRDGRSFILTGKASSVNRLERALEALEVPRSRIRSKLYWAAGESGLE
jgi:ferric-chelate reductase (NADPH)